MTSGEHWQPCERGTIQGVAEAQQRTEQSEKLTRRAVLCGTAAAVVGIGGFVIARLSGDDLLTCDQVRQVASRYTEKNLPEREIQKVNDHRKICADCDRYLTMLSTDTHV